MKMAKIMLLWLTFLVACFLPATAVSPTASENRIWEIFSIGYDAATAEVTDLGGHTETSTSNYDTAPIHGAIAEKIPTETNRALFGQNAEFKAAEEPGAWVSVNESMSARAASYQQFITGADPGQAYLVNGVKFDGFSNGILLDAKGPGYATFVNSAGEFEPFFNGADDLLDQAARQTEAAQGVPIQWHVAEPEAASAIRNLLQNAGHDIDVIHTPQPEP